MVIANGVIVVGPALELGFRPQTMANVPGYVRGFDVRTGKELWRFNTIPQAGEKYLDTWERDSWKYTGNAGVWAPFSADEALGYVYLPVEAPTGDLYGGHRLGDNVYSSSLVCLDVRSGTVVWHFQQIHHDIWDYDNTTAPMLLDVRSGGRTVKAVALMTKQAFTYVFDRVSGQPVWPIVERPVPASDVPGERAATTQPFPSKPPAFDRQGLTLDDVVDFTPEIRARGDRGADGLPARRDVPAAVAGRRARRHQGHDHPARRAGRARSGSTAPPIPRPALLYVELGDAAVAGRAREERRVGHGLRRRAAARRADGGRAADRQAAVRTHHGHRPDERRDRLAGGQRRHAAGDSRPSAAEGRDAAAHRQPIARRPAGDPDAAVRRRGLGRTAVLPRARQGHRGDGVGDGDPGGADRPAHDLSAWGPPVHRVHRRRPGPRRRRPGSSPSRCP